MRYYFRRDTKTPRVRLVGKPGTAAFLIQYAELLRQAEAEGENPASAGAAASKS